MYLFWSLFWKFFGVVLGAAFVVGLFVGIAHHSSEIVYAVIRNAIAVGLGICGVIGLVVVPVQLYIEDKARRKSGAKEQP
jgi:hypothetical protein